MGAARVWVRAIAVGSLALGAVAACHDGGGVAGPVPVAVLTVTPAVDTIDVGTTVQLTAQAKSATGQILNYTIAWTGDAYASVSSGGLVTGVAPGAATITASVGGRAATAKIQVEPVIASIDLTPTTADVVIGKTITIVATLKNPAGDTVVRAIAWTSSDSSVAQVANGVVTGVKTGTAKITATSGGKSAEATVTVLVPVASVALEPAGPITLRIGDTVKFTVTATDSAGTVLLGRLVSWVTSDPTVASVSGDGTVTAVAVGTAGITATIDDRGATATVNVEVPVATITLSQESAELLPGETVQLSATVKDGSGTTLVRPVTWSSSAPAVATVSEDGLVTAVDAGTATITATSEGLTATASISVLEPVASVLVTAASSEVAPSETLQLTATPKGRQGQALNRPVTWSSSDDAIATVSGSGLVAGVASGTATINAMSQGTGGSMTITVSKAVASVTISPSQANLLIGGTLTLTATPRDASGGALTRPVQWKSNSPTIASVDGAGVVTGLAQGSAEIVATSGGVDGTANVNVRGRASSVVVTPEAQMIDVGARMQLQGTAYDANGDVVQGAISWESSAPNIATVSATGEVTGLADGVVTITATSGSYTGSATITVEAPVASLEIAAAPDSIDMSASLQLTAVARDAGGNPLARPIAWSSSDPSVATVSAGGVVTPVAPGTTTITASGNKGPSASRSLKVLVPVATITLTPSSGNVYLGETLQLSATPVDAAGNALPRAIEWSSADAAIASVSASGEVKGEQVGQTSIHASAGGNSRSATVRVLAHVETITLTASSDSVVPGENILLAAKLVDTEGNTVVRTVTWTSSRPDIISVTQKGVATGVAPGQAAISVESEGKSASKTLGVKVPVAVVTVTALTDSVIIDSTMQLTATAKSASGATLNRPAVWSSSDNTVARVSATGAVTAMREGAATISATIDKVTGSMRLRMRPRWISREEMIAKVTAELPRSLHGTAKGMQYWYDAAGGMGPQIGISYASLNTCKGCHVYNTAVTGQPADKPCLACHKEVVGQPGVANYDSVDQAKCLKCHGRQGAEIAMNIPDVHRAAGMTCADCHTAAEVHGGADANAMHDVLSTTCENCHTPGGTGTGPRMPASLAHTRHGTRVGCQSCHMSGSVTCDNCHLEDDLTKGQRNANRRHGDWLFLGNWKGQVRPLNVSTVEYQGKTFAAWGPFGGHTITAMGRDCNTCHGTPNMTASTLQVVQWNATTKSLQNLTGVIPVPWDYQTRLLFDFVTKNADGTWSFLSSTTDRSQMLFATPLTPVQMAALATPH